MSDIIQFTEFTQQNIPFIIKKYLDYKVPFLKFCYRVVLKKKTQKNEKSNTMA